MPSAGEIAENPGVWWMSGLGRLRPGVSLEQARAEMTGLAERYNRDRHSSKASRRSSRRWPTRSSVPRGRPWSPSWEQLAWSSSSLAPTSRPSAGGPHGASERARGAPGPGGERRRPAPRHPRRGLLLGLVAGVVGVVLAYAAMPLLVSLAPPDVPRLRDVAVSGRALVFALGATLLTTLLCGLAPATPGAARVPRARPPQGLTGHRLREEPAARGPGGRGGRAGPRAPRRGRPAPSELRRAARGSRWASTPRAC